MDKYSHRHRYRNENNQTALRRKLVYFFSLAVILGAGFALYVYKPFTGIIQRLTISLLGPRQEEETHEVKNSPPPVHFEFYTTLPKAVMTDNRAPLMEAKQEKVQISSPDELEREFSVMMNKKKETK